MSNDIKLLHGDCLELMKGIPDRSVDLIVTDPPYGMNFQSNFRTEKYDAIENDKNLDWLNDFVEEAYRILKENTAFYCFCSGTILMFSKQLYKSILQSKTLLFGKRTTHQWVI